MWSLRYGPPYQLLFFLGLVCSTTAATGYFIINAPHGDDDMMNSPQLRILSAILVSRDGVDTGVSFQSTLSILSQVNYLTSFSDRRLSVFFFRFWIKRPTASTASTRFLSIQVPQNRGKHCCGNFLSSNSQQRHHQTYPLAVVSSSLTTLYNNSSCSNLAPGPIQTHGIRISFLRLPDWKMEVGRIWLSETTMTEVYFWRYPWWINDFGKQVFIS